MKENGYSLKKLFIAYSFAFSPFALVLAVLSLLNVTPVYFNERPYSGIQGFFVSIVLVPFFGVVMGAVNWVFLNMGNYFFSCFCRVIGKKENEPVE